MAAIRVYADTSVYGGCFDAEFSKPSRLFVEQVRAGRFQLVTSAVVDEELKPAPSEVRALFDELSLIAETLPISPAAIELQSAYLAAGVVGEASDADALHVALASAARCVAIVSWNFKHIVHFQKIPLYNGVNAAMGHGAIGIFSPAEVIAYE